MLFTLYRTFYNAIDYYLRQHIRWRRGGFEIIPESKGTLFSHLSDSDQNRARELAGRLVNTYHLQHFQKNSTVINYLENLYCLEMLESALNHSILSLPYNLHAVDIGTSHWFYAESLYSLLTWWHSPPGRQVALQGYEGDAFRVYADYYSRYDRAQAHIAHLPGVTFIPESFKPQPDTFDMATLLFPFVFLADHMKWGLPRRMFDPMRLIDGVWNSLKIPAVLIIVNQGGSENTAMLEILEESSIAVRATFEFNSLFYDYDLPRYVIVCDKENA